MSSSVVFDKTVSLVSDRLNLNSANQRVIASNLANIDTPGYVAKALKFEGVLRESMEEEVLKMVRSNGQHADPADASDAVKSLETEEVGAVDLDQEMVRLSRNSIEYQYMVSMLNRKFVMMKTALGEGSE